MTHDDPLTLDQLRTLRAAQVGHLTSWLWKEKHPMVAGMEEDDDRRLVACRLNATRWAVAVGLFNDGGDSWTR